MSFGDQWASATIGGDTSDPPEPGTYEVALTDGRAFTSKGSEDWFVVEFRILAGHGQDHTWSVMANLGKEGGVKAAKAMSAKLGVPIDEVTCLQDLDRLVKQQVGGYFEVDVVQNGDYRNTFIRDRVSGEAASDLPTDPAPVGGGPATFDDDDIPFGPSVI
jgi:hypothetical protein